MRVNPSLERSVRRYIYMVCVYVYIIWSMHIYIYYARRRCPST